MKNGELVCKDLTKVYRTSGGKKALDGLSFSVPSRGIFSLIGKNGSGKTTAVRILATQLEPTSGSATINGIDVMKEAGRLRGMIAAVPQEAKTVAWMSPVQTVLSYLLWRGLGYGESKKRAVDALGRIGMSEYENTLNSRLSGGQRRKVLVAAVLAADAEVTFLDEPTTGLDPISRSDLWKSLQELAKDRFLIVTTHYLEEAERLADVIGILDEGRLVGLGSLDDLRGMVKYQYSIRVPSTAKLPEVQDGLTRAGVDGQVQVLTTEDEAYRLSTELLKSGTRFAVNRITLDDVFFHFVGGEADGETTTSEAGGW